MPPRQAYELHTDNASLQWLQQQRHVSHRQARALAQPARRVQAQRRAHSGPNQPRRGSPILTVAFDIKMLSTGANG